MLNDELFEVGTLAQQLVHGYYTHIAAVQVAGHAMAENMGPESIPGTSTSVGFVTRKDGSYHAFDFKHYLRRVVHDRAIEEELPRIWLAGSLLRLGDALTRYQYFDRAPILEMIRHLRNGVAHGNHFRIDNANILRNYPAHTKQALVKSDTGKEFEILPSLNGQAVFFDYMGPADVLDVFLSAGLYLLRKSGR